MRRVHLGLILLTLLVPAVMVGAVYLFWRTVLPPGHAMPAPVSRIAEAERITGLRLQPYGVLVWGNYRRQWNSTFTAKVALNQHGATDLLTQTALKELNVRKNEGLEEFNTTAIPHWPAGIPLPRTKHYTHGTLVLGGGMLFVLLVHDDPAGPVLYLCQVY